MSEHLESANLLVWTNDHLFFLSEEEMGTSIPKFTNSLITAAPEFAAIAVGNYMGEVRVTAEIHEVEPSVDTTNWDEVAEVTLEATVGRVRVLSADDSIPVASSPLLTTRGPGHYRIRAHARGRDNAFDLAVDEPVEDYLMQVWPAPPAPQRIYKQTDRYGSLWVLAAS